MESSDNFNEKSHNLNTTLTQLQHCSDSTQGEKLPMKKHLSLNFEFDYKIEIVSKTPTKDQSISDDILDFNHELEIRNAKMSPLNERKIFTIHVPDALDGTPVFRNKDQANCREHQVIKTRLASPESGVSRKEDESFLQISCETHMCKRFDCTLMPGIVAKEPVKIEIRMTLDPNQDIFNVPGIERFEVITKINIDGEEVTSTTSFNRNSVGGSEAIWEWWPVIVGVAIVTVLFGACIYGLKKSGILQKMRYYDNLPDVPPQEVKISESVQSPYYAGDGTPVEVQLE